LCADALVALIWSYQQAGQEMPVRHGCQAQPTNDLASSPHNPASRLWPNPVATVIGPVELDDQGVLRGRELQEF